MTAVDIFWTYLQMPSAQVAVVFPFFLSLCALVLSSRVPLVIMLWWAVFTGVSSLTARWVHSPDGNELFIVPWFLLLVVVTSYFGHRWSPAHAYSLSFLSVFCVDVWQAYLLSLTGVIPSTGFFYGVGGAGFGDGLFLMPFAAVALVGYIAWRRGEVSLMQLFARKGRGHHASPHP